MKMDLDQIRAEKIKELQANQEEEQKVQEEIAAIENSAKNYLEKEALVRYGNLKSAFPEKSAQVMAVINQLVQQGQLNKKLNDMEFKELLRSLNPKKKEIKIIRK